jgi:hypothetical protein
MRELAEWESFYLIIGGAAGALIGLQFVVVTLIAQRPSLRVAEGGAAFGTPTIVHFSVALLLSALVRAPWPSIGMAAVAWGIVGLGGLVYAAVIARHMRAQQVYEPVFEDWAAHVVAPVIAYGALAVSALTARSCPHESLFGVGAASLLLLFIGIHNSWDAVSWHVFNRDHPPGVKSRRGKERLRKT